MTTSPLRERLSDLADEWQDGLSAPDARMIWHAGRARRIRARVVSAGVAVVLVLLAFAVAVPGEAPLAVPAGGSVSGPHSFPQRIGHQWWTPDYRPGAGRAAVLVERVAHHGTWDDPLGWFVVQPDGRQLKIPVRGDLMPSISRDGAWVGWMRNGREYVLWSTVRKVEVVVRVQGEVQPQLPSYWNAQGTKVFVPLWSHDQAGLVISTDGTKEVVPPTDGPVHGWIGDALARVTTEGRGAGRNEVIVRTWRAGDAWTRATVLSVAEALSRDASVTQFDASFSPDSTTVAVAITTAASPDANATVYRLSDGRPVLWSATGVPVASGPTVESVPFSDDVCPMTWRGGSLLSRVDASQDPGSEGGRALVRYGPAGVTSRLVVTEGRAGVGCMVWAQDALDGSPSWTPFGTSTSWLSWWWKEVLGALVTLAGIVWIALRRRRAAASRYLAHG